MHGDIVTNITLPAAQAENTPSTSIDAWSDYTKFGIPRDTIATTAVAGAAGFGWLGAKERSTTTDSAGLTLMGDRLYNPVTGRFTSPDPEPGGNTTAYTYPTDPINMVDINGRFAMFVVWGVIAVVRVYQGYRVYRAARTAAMGVKLAKRQGFNRVYVVGRKKRIKYDVAGKSHGPVKTPHYTTSGRSSRAPSGWQKFDNSSTRLMKRRHMYHARYISWRRGCHKHHTHVK